MSGGDGVCTHFTRSCSVFTTCCKKKYPCHVCHNEAGKCKKVVKAADVKVVCNECGVEGKNGPKCMHCKTSLAVIFCEKCVIWDDTDRHCKACGFCVKKNLTHCDKCKRCDTPHICPDDIPPSTKCTKCDTPFSVSTSDSVIKSSCGNLLYHRRCLSLISSPVPSEMSNGVSPAFTHRVDDSTAHSTLIIREADIAGFNLDLSPDSESKISVSIYCTADHVARNTKDKSETGSWKVEKGRLLLSNIQGNKYKFAGTDYIPPHPSDLTMKEIGGRAILTVRPGLEKDTRVKRCPKYWQWDEQDGGDGCLGRIQDGVDKAREGGCWASVKWDKSGDTNSYRWGSEHALDLFTDHCRTPSSSPPTAPKIRVHQPTNYIVFENTAYCLLGDMPFDTTSAPSSATLIPLRWEPAGLTSILVTFFAKMKVWSQVEIADRNGEVYKGSKKVTSGVKISTEMRKYKVARSKCNLLLRSTTALEWVRHTKGGRVVRLYDMVRVSADVAKPKHGWGSVKHGHTGTVSKITSEEKCTVYFSTDGWSAASAEMEIQTLPTETAAATPSTESNELLHQHELCTACCERYNKSSKECSGNDHLYQPSSQLNRKDMKIKVPTPVKATIVGKTIREPGIALKQFRGRVVAKINGETMATDKEIQKAFSDVENTAIDIEFEPCEETMESCHGCGVEIRTDGKERWDSFGCSCSGLLFCPWCVVKSNKKVQIQGEGCLQSCRVGDRPPCVIPNDVYWHESHGLCSAVRSTQHFAEMRVFGKPIAPRLAPLSPADDPDLASNNNPSVIFPCLGHYTAMSVAGAAVSKGVLQFDITVETKSRTSKIFVGFTTPDLVPEHRESASLPGTPSCTINCATGYVYINDKQTKLGLPALLPGGTVHCYLDLDKGVVYFRSNGTTTEAVAVNEVFRSICQARGIAAFPYAIGNECIVSDRIRTSEDPTFWVLKEWLWYSTGPYHSGAMVSIGGDKLATVVVPPIEGRVTVRMDSGCLEEIVLDGKSLCPVYATSARCKVTSSGRLVAPDNVTGEYYCGSSYPEPDMSHPGITLSAHCVPSQWKEPCKACREEQPSTLDGKQNPVHFYNDATGKTCRGLLLEQDTDGSHTVLTFPEGALARSVPSKRIRAAKFLYEVGERVTSFDILTAGETEAAEAILSRTLSDTGEAYYKIEKGWVRSDALRPAFSPSLVYNSTAAPPHWAWQCPVTEAFTCSLKGPCESCEKLRFGRATVITDKPDKKKEKKEEPETKKDPVLDEKDVPPPTTWTCKVCTFVNPLDKAKCEMCESAKPAEKKKRETLTKGKKKLAAGCDVFVKVNKRTAKVSERVTDGKYKGKYKIIYDDGSSYHCTPGELKLLKEKDEPSKEPDKTAKTDAPPSSLYGARVYKEKNKPPEITTIDDVGREFISASPIPLLSKIIALPHGPGVVARYFPDDDTYLVSIEGVKFVVVPFNDIIPDHRKEKWGVTSSGRISWKQRDGKFYCKLPGTTQCIDCAHMSNETLQGLHSVGDAVMVKKNEAARAESAFIVRITPETIHVVGSGKESLEVAHHLVRPSTARKDIHDPFTTAFDNATLLKRTVERKRLILPASDAQRMKTPKIAVDLWPAKERAGFLIHFDLAARIFSFTTPSSSCSLARCSSLWAFVHGKHFKVTVHDVSDLKNAVSQKRTVDKVRFTSSDFNTICDEEMEGIAATTVALELTGTSTDDDNMAVRNIIGGVDVPWEAREPGKCLEQINDGSIEATDEEKSEMLSLIVKDMEKKVGGCKPADFYKYILTQLKSIDEEEEARYLNLARFEIMRKNKKTVSLLRSTDGCVDGYTSVASLWVPGAPGLKTGMIARRKKNPKTGYIIATEGAEVKVEFSGEIWKGCPTGLEIRIPSVSEGPDGYRIDTENRKFKNLASLTFAQFTHGSRKISPVDVRVFENSPMLKELEFNEVALNVSEIQNLMRCLASSRITTLRLQNRKDLYQLSTLCEAEVVVPNMRRFAFQQTKITAADVTGVQKIFPNLEQLCLASNCTGEKSEARFTPGLLKFASLKRLKIAHENTNCKCFENDGEQWGKVLSNFSSFDRFEVAGANPFNATPEAGSSYTQAAFLVCSATGIEKIPKSFSGFFGNLTKLHVTNLPLDGLDTFSVMFGGNKHLRDVKVTIRLQSVRHVTDEAIMLVAKTQKNLKDFSLSGHQATLDGMSAWFPYTSRSVRILAVSNPGLRSLSLAGSLVSDDGVAFLATHLRMLNHLNLTGCCLLNGLAPVYSVPKRAVSLEITGDGLALLEELHNNITFLSP